MSKLKNDRGDLGFLGEDFQFRFVKYLIDDHKYFRDIHSIVDQNAFVSDPNQPNSHLKIIVTVLKDFFEKEDYSPSYETIEIELRSKASSDIHALQLVETLQKIKETTCEAQDRIRDLGTKFFKQQNLIKAINQITKITKEGDVSKYDACEQIIRNALSVATGEDLGFDIFEGMEEALMEDFRKPIPTGASLLDKALEGGIGQGEIGLVIAPSGIGKSTLATAFSSYAATYRDSEKDINGFKALQIFFEDKPKQIQRKHYGRITGIEARNLSKEEYKEHVKDVLKSYPDRELLKQNLRLKKFYNKTITVDGLRNYLRTLINSGFKPDLVVIDYFECLVMNKIDHSMTGKSEWSVEGDTYRSLESLAEEFGVALWVFTQATKEAATVQTIDNSKSSGSKTKVDASHIVLALSRTPEDMLNNLITFSLNKNRGGVAGFQWNGVKLNNGIAVIDMSSVVSFDPNEEYQKDQEAIKEKQMKEMLKKAQKDVKVAKINEELERYNPNNFNIDEVPF